MDDYKGTEFNFDFGIGDVKLQNFNPSVQFNFSGKGVKYISEIISDLTGKTNQNLVTGIDNI